MLKIEYEIKLNDSGRPCIDLSNDYEEKPEDKFFVLELARYLIQNIYNFKSTDFDKTTANKINDCIIILGQISDEVAMLLFEQMKVMGDTSIKTNRNYHIQVNNIEERNNLNYNGIIYNNKIYAREIGLKVLVLSDMRIYELNNGIDNNNWGEVK